MRHKPIRTTATQRLALQQLQKRLAERGYWIFPVAREFRRHSLDFIAIPKDEPWRLLLVSSQRNGSLQARPAFVSVLHRENVAFMKQLKLACKITVSRKQLQNVPWVSFLTTQSHKEYSALTQTHLAL